MQTSIHKIDLLNIDSFIRLGGRRKNDELFRLLIDLMDEGIVIVEDDGSVLYANNKFSELLGSSNEEIVSQNITAYLDDQNQLLWQEGLENCIKSKIYKNEIVWINSCDKQIVSAVSMQIIENKPLNDNIFFIIINDITARKNAQRELEQSEQKYINVVENTLVGLYIEQQGKIIYLNRHFAQILGYERNELLDKEIASLFQSDNNNIIGELTIHRKSGEVIWVQSNCIPIEYQGLPANLGNVIDITHQKRLEKNLRNSKLELETISNKLLVAQENERKRIAAELHDGIGQSLTAIKFRIEYLIQQGEFSQHDSQADCLKKLLPMLKTVTDETRRIAMALRPSILDDLSLKATLSWFCREYQMIYPSIAIESHVNIDEAALSEILKTTIYRIIQESLNNIAKHSQATAVLIQLTDKPNQLELYIEDNGIGFSLNEFNTSSSEYIGLGISSIKHRVKQTGGSLSIDYKRNHQGSVIRSIWKSI